MLNKSLSVTLLFFLLAMMFQPVHAQESTDLPVYIVQPGDTINTIAIRFNVSSIDLIDINQIQNPDFLSAGDRLKIPGLNGVQGVITTAAVPLGMTLDTAARKYQVPLDLVVKLNRITSPNEIYVGSSLIIPINEEETPLSTVINVQPGQSNLELAIKDQINPWEITLQNYLKSPSQLIPGKLFLSNKANTVASEALISPMVAEISVSPLPLVQGQTTEIKIKTIKPFDLTGTLNGKNLAFQPIGENEYVALQGIHAMAKIGLVEFSLQGFSSDNSTFSFEQPILLEPGYFPTDPTISVDPVTIDPTVTAPEEEIIQNIIKNITPERYWTGVFKQPVDEPACTFSLFGNRRSYNNGPVSFFHTGIDYGVCANLNIYSPAAGVVVFSGPLTVRGNATIIDHGWGIYSGIWHQSKSLVQVGNRVEAGQLIGEIGGTGRASGPHLHWEVWVNGVQVQPLTWLETVFP